jgi:radical SAM superfamily enzyme YgiQ (UPF0313 family)
MPKSAAKSSGGYNVFPVGIAYVSANLKKHDYNVYTSNLEFSLQSTFEALNHLIQTNDIDVICTSGLSRDYAKVKEIIDSARQIRPGILTVIGGGIISSDPETAMAALNADIGVIGEGEVTMCELAHALDHNLSYADVPGLILRNGQQGFIKTADRTEVPDIDSIPLPDYEGFDYPEYIKSINYGAAYIIASRSCPFSCTFCFHPSGKKYRQRSLDNLFAEIDLLIHGYGLKSLVISDELFAVKKNRVFDFCQRIAPYNITWSLQLRVSDVDAEMLRVMHDAGCICISYGLESADNTVLHSMKKHITVEQIEHALKLTYDMNIDIQGGFIFGDIAENKDTAANTLQWHTDHAHYGLELNMINIFPGTPLYNHACMHGIIENKINYLKEGCPLINVSELTDEEYKDLASIIYEKNMRPKYLPDRFSITSLEPNGNGKVEMACNKCGFAHSFTTNLLHIKRMLCPNCRQRHYVDPFERISHSEQAMQNYFEHDDRVALWGAGEICIKLLDKYPFFKDDKFIVVDISKSRQGYSLCGKKIFSPTMIHERNIRTVIIAVVNRKNEVLDHLNQKYRSIENIYVPDIADMKDQPMLILKKIET